MNTSKTLMYESSCKNGWQSAVPADQALPFAAPDPVISKSFSTMSHLSPCSNDTQTFSGNKGYCSYSDVPMIRCSKTSNFHPLYAESPNSQHQHCSFVNALCSIKRDEIVEAQSDGICQQKQGQELCETWIKNGNIDLFSVHSSSQSSSSLYRSVGEMSKKFANQTADTMICPSTSQAGSQLRTIDMNHELKLSNALQNAGNANDFKREQTESSDKADGSVTNKSSLVSGVPMLHQVVRPKSGRAKTNAELKRQLMERREQQRLRDQPAAGFIGLTTTQSSGVHPTTVASLISTESVVTEKDIVIPSASCTTAAVTAERSAVPSTGWIVGDMLWAKVSGHPWWPCMIAPDPFQSNFTKLLPRGQKGMMRQYHVLFFGDEGERGWVIESSAIVYAGRSAFDRHCQSVAGQSNVKERKNYVIAANRRRAWEIAVASAEHAWMLSREQRVAEFLPSSPTSSSTATVDGVLCTVENRPGDYQVESRLMTDSSACSVVDHRTVSSKRLSKNIDGLEVETLSPAKKARMGLSFREQLDSPSPNREKTMDQFTLFCQSRREALIRCHSDYSEEELNKLLKEEWGMLKSKTGLNITAPSPGTLNSNRSPTLSSQKEVVAPSNGRTMSVQQNQVSRQPDQIMSVDKVSSTPLPVAVKKRGRPSRESMDTFITPASPNRQMLAKSATAAVVTTASWPRWDICPQSDILNVNICRICEHPCESSGSLLTCSGVCLRVFHASCVPSALAANIVGQPSFMCDECRTGSRVCFKCKVSSSLSQPVKRCTSLACDRFYHAGCANGHGDVCALHSCATCSMNAEGDSSTSTNDSSLLYQCVRCPIAYHMTYTCLAAGCQLIGGSAIVCSRHVVPAKVHSHISTTWCLTCDKGGSLIHCEICPASYHSSCLPNASSLSSSNARWTCPDCARGRRPLYGDVVWVKYSNYRWWPGQICYPDTVPINIRDLPHDVGQFAVYFFGTRDYLWTHHARVLPYRGKENGYLEQPTASKSLARVFQKALREVREMYSLWLSGKRFAMNVPLKSYDKNDLTLLSNEKLNMPNISSTNSVSSKPSDGANEDTSRHSLSSLGVRRASTSAVSNCDKPAVSSNVRRHSTCDVSSMRQVSSPLEPIYEKSSSNGLSMDIEYSSVSAKRLSVNSLDSEDYFSYLAVDVQPLK